MLKKHKYIILASGLLLTVANITPALAATFSGNFSATNNYIWRGVTQTDDATAIQGGLDYAHPTGLSYGAWISNVDFGTKGQELDLYIDYGFDVGKVDLNGGMIAYTYPTISNSDFVEIYGQMNINNFNAGLFITVSNDARNKDNDIYINGSYAMEIKKGLTLELLAGIYNYDDSTVEDYVHFRIAIAKDDLTFSIDKNDLKASTAVKSADDARFSITWNKSFDM